MRIAVVGSRTYNNKYFIFSKLDELINKLNTNITIVSGGAKGVDSIAKEYALLNNYGLVEYLPDYSIENKRLAPILRNSTIVNNSDYLIAFTTGSKGTQDSINKAIKKGIEVIIHKV